jgi:hypothetical protein
VILISGKKSLFDQILMSGFAYGGPKNINELLQSHQNSPFGIKIDDDKFNYVTYTDDVTLMKSCSDDLQKMINMCTDYAEKWCFSFGV